MSRDENYDDIIAAFDQAYDNGNRRRKNEPKPKSSQIIIGQALKKKKRKNNVKRFDEDITEQILPVSSSNINSNIENTVVLHAVNKYYSTGASINIGKRKSQQDSIVLSNDDFDNPCVTNIVYGVLSDGMGGMKGGEKASSLCTSRMMQLYRNVNFNDFPSFIEKCFDTIDCEIAELKDDNGNQLGAGATMITFIAVDNRLYWASVGDSHLYIINKDGITMLNKEHNYMMRLKAMVEDGTITIEQANQNKQKEALISYMGMNGLDLIDISEKPVLLNSEDVVLACSDGLYRSLSDSEIETTVRSSIDDIPLLANILINKALDKQYKYQDNVSVIIIKKI